MITTINEFKNQLNENNAYDYYWSQFHAKIWKSPIFGWRWTIDSVNNDYYKYQSDIDADLQTAVDAEMDMINFCEETIGSKPEIQINENYSEIPNDSISTISNAYNREIITFFNGFEISFDYAKIKENYAIISYKTKDAHTTHKFNAKHTQNWDKIDMYAEFGETKLLANEFVYAIKNVQSKYLNSKWFLDLDTMSKEEFKIEHGSDYDKTLNQKQKIIDLIKTLDEIILKINNINENHMVHIGSLNPDKKDLFKKSTFSPSFQSVIYGALRDILPQSYKIDIKKFGDKNTLSITDFNGKRFAFRIEDNTTISKIMKMIKAQMKITENLDNDKPLDSDYFCNTVMKHAEDLESEDLQLANDLKKLCYSVKTFYPNKDISIHNVYSVAYEIDMTNQDALNEIEMIWNAL